MFGFSYLQKIGKGASTSVWFPPSIEEQIAKRIQNGDTSILDEFKVEWAAVRQFELLQENGNGEIYPLEVTIMDFAYRMLMRQRAGGMRVTIITLGTYTNPGQYDELRILDQRLQEAISQFISMLYLEEQSAIAQHDIDVQQRTGQWNYAEALPHIAITVGAGQLFNPTKSAKAEARFLQLLEMLPSHQIQHDIAVGLQIPEAAARNEEIRIIPEEQRFCQFQTALSNVFRGYDDLSLGKLHERADADNEVKSSMTFMRGYGDHMRNDFDSHYKNLASHMRSLEVININ